MQSILRRSTVYFMIFTLVLTTAFTFSVSPVHGAAAPKKIVLTKAATYVDIGAKLKVSVKSTTPKKASKKVTWKITKGSKYGKLSKKANTSAYVYGQKSGTITVKATSTAKKSVTKSTKVIVKNLKAVKVTLNAKAQNIGKGKTVTLRATVTKPQKGIGYKSQTTVWKSSNKAAATVNSKGLVTATGYGTAVITASNDGKSTSCKITVPKTKVLRPYVLVGYYSPSKLNAVTLDKNAKVQVWNKTTRAFNSGTKNEATILGNFTQLEDDDGDNDADIIKVVKRQDSTSMWNKDMTWKSGIGTDISPQITDATADYLYNVESRIPFGERLLTGYGIGDYCGVNDFKNVDNSPYWPTYDYYNLKSGNNLVMLEGYKSTPQTTGSMCVMSSALTTLDWYGVRGDLNEEDLGALRGADRKWGGGTSIYELRTMYERLDELDLAGNADWIIEDSTKNNAESLYDPAWIKAHLKAGHPITVIWNSFGAHGQVIIGYDDRGTAVTADDQLILMDPYDSTDHDNDGYSIQSYERLAYGTLSWDEVSNTKFLVAYPKDWQWSPSTGGAGLANVNSNTLKANDANKLNGKVLDQTKTDIKRWYKKDIADSTTPAPYTPKITGIGGAWAYEHFADYDKSPYYNFYDFYNYKNETSTTPTDSLTMLENFRTVQQATEWTCGCTSALMNMEWFDQNKDDSGDLLDTEITIAKSRQNGKRGATYLSGMQKIFDGFNNSYDQDWVTFTTKDLRYDEREDANFIGGKALEWGRGDDGLIPYLIDNGIPMMIGWDEWGGHWQVIVGYDDMNTAETQDDVLILADPYDTTDHDCDGYYVEGFERLVYGWNASFEKNVDGPDDGPDYDDFIIAFPRSGNEAIIKELDLPM